MFNWAFVHLQLYDLFLDVMGIQFGFGICKLIIIAGLPMIIRNTSDQTDASSRSGRELHPFILFLSLII